MASNTEAPCSRNPLMKLTSTMPLSIATPNTAMYQMTAGTDRYCPLIHGDTMPPMIAKGTLVMVSAAYFAELKGGVEQHEDEEDCDGYDDR